MPPRFDFEYFQQLVAEERVTERVRGFGVERWFKRHDRNEALDQWAMHLASLDKLNPNWSALATRYGKKEEKPAETEPQRVVTSAKLATKPTMPPRRVMGPRRLGPRRGGRW